MSRFSFNKLIINFFYILVTIITVVLAITIYFSFDAKHKQSQLKLEQSNSQKIDTLVHDLQIKYDDVVANLNLEGNVEQTTYNKPNALKIQENIYSLILELLNELNIRHDDLPSSIKLVDAISTTSLKQLDTVIKLLQIHNKAINQQLHKKFLHPEEFKRLNTELTSINNNKYKTPLRLNVYQLNKYQHKRLARKFQQLSDRKGWDVDFKADYQNRSITLDRLDADFIDNLDGNENGQYELKSRLRSGSLLTVYVERITWGLPNSEQEKKQTLLNRKFKMRDDIDQEILDQIEVESPMIIVACYLLSKKTFFGESSHPFFSGAELFIKQLRNFEKGIDTNHLVFQTATFPPNISNFNEKSNEVYVFPRNAIVLMLNKPWLMRSLVSKFLENRQLDNVFVQFPETDSQFNLYKLNHLDKAIAVNSKEAVANFNNHVKVSWNKQTPTHSIEKINNAKFVLTSKIVHLGSNLKFRVYLWQAIDTFNTSLYFDYLLLALSLMLILFILYKIRKDWNTLQNVMQECINLVISGQTISSSTSRNELEILGQSISMFNQQIKWRKEFTLLKRRILHVINIPRLEPKQYLEELKYACSDTANRFQFDVVTNPVNHPYVIKVKIGDGWKEELKTTESLLQLRFKGPLRKVEMEQLNYDLQTLIQRAEIQNHLRKSDQLEADIELSQKLQRVLDPIMNQTKLVPDNIQMEPVLVRTNLMQFDAMDQVVTNKIINIYHIDINDRGLSSALISTSLKSILHSLLQFEHTPAETLLEFNNMILSQDIVNLFVSCAVLQIDIEQNRLRFSSAGHAGLWKNNEGGYTSIHRQGVPLGIETKPCFKDWSNKMIKGDFCIFNNNVHLANRLPNKKIYNQTIDLKTTATEVTNIAKRDNLDFDYCAWLVRVL